MSVSFKAFIHPYPETSDAVPSSDAAANSDDLTNPPLPDVPVPPPDKEPEALPGLQELDEQVRKVLCSEFDKCTELPKCPFRDFGPTVYTAADLSPAPSPVEILGGMVSACAIGVLIGYLAFSKPAVCAP